MPAHRRTSAPEDQPDRPSWWSALLNGLSNGAARALVEWLLRR